jgi:hypothetical protein
MIKINLYIILKDGIKSLLHNIDGNSRSTIHMVTILLLIPILLIVLSVYNSTLFPHKIVDTFISALSIFTALIFGIIFIAPDKLSQRVELFKNQKDDAITNYIIRYKNFTKSFIAQIGSIIIIAIILLVMLLIYSILVSDDEQIRNMPITLHRLHKTIATIISSIIIFLSYEFFVYLFVLISNIYVLLKDDIKETMNRRNKDIKQN